MLSTEGNPTYNKVDRTMNEILEVHIREILDRINIALTDKDMDLPFIYWTPKFHKSPIKFRFIVASSKCSTKPLSGKLSLAFKLVEQQHRRYCEKVYMYTGIQRMWVIHNSKQVHATIDLINKRKGARNINTFDFSTLYTMIEHCELKDQMASVIDTAFKGSKVENISIYNSSARWTSQPRSGTFSVNCESLKDMLNFLVDNIYFRVGNCIF